MLSETATSQVRGVAMQPLNHLIGAVEWRVTSVY